MKLEILFENENFVAVDKEAMILTTPSREGEDDDRPCLGRELQKHLGVQIFPVHRLDFEVSGIVMFAKNPKAHSTANSWFEHKKVFKTYHAYTGNQTFAHIPESVENRRQFFTLDQGEEFVWKSRLLRGKRRTYEHKTGKPSETKANYLSIDAETGWHQWELFPLTGRPHQLRFELSSHGYPIVGDKLYGSDVEFNQPGIALRAVEIDFSRAPQASSLGLPESLQVLV
ncbi:MAG: RNA pseudouridine synthase [Bdellovibrionaceae bacterium]|nr:RNA pseudouridine synthase [Pseudobdellovibrionaceae bacterium]